MTAPGLAMLCVLLQAPSATPPRPAAPAPSKILVVPLENTRRDGHVYWLGEAAAVLIADELSARGLGAITRASRVHAFEQLHLPVSAALSRATIIRVGQLVGASEVIVGEFQVDGEELTVHARPIRIDVGRADGEITERGLLKDLFATFERVSRRLVAGETAAAPPPPTGPPPALQAFEQYVKGLLAERSASQATFLETAVKLDPAYDRARLALWEVRNAQGDHAAALAAVRGVKPGSPAARQARFLSGVTLLAIKQHDEAFTVFKALEDERTDAAVLDNLGVVQLRRGGTPETGLATYFFTKASDADPEDPDILFNLGYAYALERDSKGAMYWLREAVRRNPADGDAHFVLAAALDTSGSGVEAARERELASQLSSKYPESSRRGGPDVVVPRGLERVRQDLEVFRSRGVDQAIVDTAQRDQHDLAAFHLDRGRRLFEREQDREAMAELQRVVFLSPYEAEAHLLMGRIHLREGRVREATEALKISIWSQETAAAHVALAEAYLRLKEVGSARTHVQRALVLEPASQSAKQLQERIDRGGASGSR